MSVDGYHPGPVRELLMRSEAAQAKRDAHQLRVENARLRKQAAWYRRKLVGYCGPTTLRIWEADAPEVFPGAQEFLDRMG